MSRRVSVGFVVYINTLRQRGVGGRVQVETTNTQYPCRVGPCREWRMPNGDINQAYHGNNLTPITLGTMNVLNLDL